MTKKEFMNLLTGATSVIINLLGQTIKIIKMRSGAYEIGSIAEPQYEEYASVDEMMDDYMVMNMSLGSLTRWMSVSAVA